MTTLESRLADYRAQIERLEERGRAQEPADRRATGAAEARRAEADAGGSGTGEGELMLHFLQAQCGARYPLRDGEDPHTDPMYANNIREKDGAIRICVYSSSGGANAPTHLDGRYAACRVLGCDKPRGTARKAGVKGPFDIFICDKDGNTVLDEKGHARMGFAMTCHFEVVDAAK